MGSEFSACCISSPLPKKSINQDDQDDVILDIDTLDNETHFEDLSHLVYDLVSEDKYDVLQQLINNNVIDITTIHWKNNLNPLHISAMRGHLATTQMLIINGLNPNEIDKLGRTPLHWAARNKHQEVFDFLKPMTLNPSRRDIYGISADTFYFENPFFMENSSNFSTPPQSPTSLSSLTLHTISLSTNEHSPAESQILSPRVMDVSIRPQPFSPPKSTYQFSNFMLEKASKSPFLLEEKSELSTSSVTEEEWVPPIECLNSQTATSDQFDCHHSHVSLPRLQIESTSNISQGRNPGSHDLIIDTSKPQSKKFYTLRRKISLMLFNHEEGETPTSFQKLSFPEQQLLLVSHSSHNPLNDSTASEGSQDEDQYDVNLADMMTPISQSTTISTNSDDLPTKSYWLTWKNFDFKWKKSKKTHHQRSYSNQSDDFPELSTIKPFTS